MGFMRAEQVFHFGESKTPSLLFPFKNLMNPKTTFVVCVRALGLDLNQGALVTSSDLAHLRSEIFY